MKHLSTKMLDALTMAPADYRREFEVFILKHLDADCDCIGRNNRGVFIIDAKYYRLNKDAGRSDAEIFAEIDVEKSYISFGAIFDFLQTLDDKNHLFTVIREYIEAEHVEIAKLEKRCIPVANRVVMIERK